MVKKPLSKSELVEARLRAGQLPKMVAWFDPVILGHVGVRTMLSSTIGEYADQRPMQAALDSDDSPEQLARRHDYSDLTPKDGTTALNLDDRGSLWVDFIADLGDGFEATYAMAYLMAASSMEVDGLSKAEGRLPAGDILILGGDLAYPNATIKEYQDRCVEPYDLAFQTDRPKRKLFFIAGNHDWYDGLVAFTSVFCAARDRYSRGLGKQIGGWQCQQRRSYFGLKLPYGWWIWGYDVGLSDTVDDSQREYFRTMAEYTKPGDKIILITHAPDWLKPQYRSLTEMMALARVKGAEVRTVLVGDLHHYTRYSSPDCDVPLITSGGGGAFLHPTHQLKESVELHLPLPTKAQTEPVQHVSEVERRTAELMAAAGQLGAELHLPRHLPMQEPPATTQIYSSECLYPSRARSRFLSFANLALPFNNTRLAILLGVVYMVYAWTFLIAAADPLETAKKIHQQFGDQRCVMATIVGGLTKEQERLCRQVFYEAVENDINGVPLRYSNAALAKLEKIIDENKGWSSETREQFRAYMKSVDGLNAPKDVKIPFSKPKQSWSEFSKEGYEKFKKIAHTSWRAAVIMLGPGRPLLNQYLSPSRIITAMIDNISFFILMVGLWAGLVFYVDRVSKRPWLNALLALGLGSAHFVAHVYLMFAINVFAHFLVYAPWVEGADAGSAANLAGLLFYSISMVAVGGLLGSMAFGLYWVLTSVFGNMHMESFSALGMKGYKNFLRLRFDKDGSLTIYAIGLATVPGRRGWRATPRDHPARLDHNPALVPTSPLKPHLIETVVILPGARPPAEERVPIAERLQELSRPSPVELVKPQQATPVALVKPQPAPSPVELAKPPPPPPPKGKK